MELQKAISDLDKLATTPIPSAYSFHLKMTVLLYLFFLPFQLQQYLNWVCIPATAIASIVYLGFLEIGNQIEMPFAYDQSDLDLDKYVLKIAMQLAEITAVSFILHQIGQKLMSSSPPQSLPLTQSSLT
jgi:putative membrane protein